VAGTAATTPTPATTSDQLNQAQQFVTTGDYKGAISLLNEVLKTDSRNVSANFFLGTAYLNAPIEQLGGVDRFDQALKSFTRVTELAPTWAGGYARLGETYGVKGDLPSAIAAFTRSLELDPNGSERWLALAGLYQRNNQPAEAAYARSRAQGLNPTPVGSVAATTPVGTSTAIPAPTPTASR
jgi:FimV-like protein